MATVIMRPKDEAAMTCSKPGCTHPATVIIEPHPAWAFAIQPRPLCSEHAEPMERGTKKGSYHA